MIKSFSSIKKEHDSLKNKLTEIKDTLDKITSSDLSNTSLMGGSTGLMLFYFYYSKYTNSQNSYDKGYELIDQVFESINNGNNYHTFSGGVVGIGWSTEHLEEQNFIDSDTNEMLSELDKYAYDTMVLEIQNNNFDFLHGAIGSGIYFLKRLYKNPKIEGYLIELIDEIEKASEQDVEGGIKWGSYAYLGDKKGYNLSLSHGISSNIFFLSKVYELNVNKEKALKLLNGAITYLLNNQLDTSIHYSMFPNGIVESENPSNSRLAWCYGDLGIGMALYQAGKITGNSHWVDKAIEILLFTTKRRTDDVTSVVDAGLCHGSAGIAHIYNRMYGYTKNVIFKESADYWFSRTLEMAKFNDGLAGYKAYRNQKTGGYSNEPGLLEGIAGIGLALISYLSDIEPAWDECLLLS